MTNSMGWLACAPPERDEVFQDKCSLLLFTQLAEIANFVARNKTCNDARFALRRTGVSGWFNYVLIC